MSRNVLVVDYKGNYKQYTIKLVPDDSSVLVVKKNLNHSFGAYGQLSFLKEENNKNGGFPLFSNTRKRIRNRMMLEKSGSELGVR